MILDTIKFDYTYADNEQDKAWTPSHIVYDCTIKHNNKQYSFTYQCNENAEVKLADVMECLLLDANTFNNCRNPYILMSEFGYDDLNIYKACRRTYDALNRLFTTEELETLREEVEEY